MKLFETYPQVERFTQPNELKKLRFVIQNTRSVIKCFSGLESFAIVYLWNNLKPNQFVLVFDDETEEMLGYISKNEIGIPKRYKEMEHLTFSDMYQKA